MPACLSCHGEIRPAGRRGHPPAICDECAEEIRRGPLWPGIACVICGADLDRPQALTCSDRCRQQLHRLTRGRR